MRSTGVGLALLAAVLFGASAPAAKGLLGGVAPQLLAGLLYLGSGTGLLLVWTLRRRGLAPGGAAAEAPLGRPDLPWLAGAILSGGVLGPLLLLLGLARTPASTASLLLNLEGVFTAALAWLVFREHVHRRIVVGMLAIVAGGVLLSWQGGLAGGSLIGPAAVAAACLAWAIDNNLTQRISAGDPIQITMLKGLVAGTTNTVLAFTLGAALPAPGIALAAAVVGFLGYGVSLVLYVRALRELGTARTGAYFSLAPFIGAVLGIVLWHEAVAPLFLAAAALMGLGLWLHLTEHHEHLHTHAPLEHSHAHV
ncbi:MAG TPA: DMT family transporter, partial [Gemmatimonadales bacterium]|nr:DMT family transporter [Gemmatimonadales bacterium]